jgi:drug/metabolite transporter (DMT)-like permease
MSSQHDAPIENIKIQALPVEERDNMRGIFWMIISVLGASLMTVVVRLMSLEMSSIEVVLYRSVLTTAVISLGIILFSPLRKQLSFSKPITHIIRGLLIAAATHFGFYTIAHIPLATATVLFFTAPIFATILSIFVHGETIGMRRILAIIAGFVGAIVVLRPGFGELSFGMLTAIGSSLCFATVLAMTRGIAQADGPLSAYFSSIVITVICTLPLLGTDFIVPTSGMTWFFLSVVAFASMVRGFADIYAYRHGEAAILAPFAYTRLIFIGIAAYVMFNEVPDMPTIIGAVVIVTSTLYIAHREARLKKAK